MYALIGIGANDIEIPLAVFFSWRDAFNHLAEHLRISEEYHVLTYFAYRYSGSQKYKTKQRYFADRQRQMELDMKALKESGDFISLDVESFTRDRNFTINFDFDNEENDEVLKSFFKNGNYYGGCGGCYAIEVRRVEYGEPMVGWNLD